MLRSFLARLKAIPRAGDRSENASILLPFLIISIGLGVLAWRSYQLSARLEAGVNTLAVQYASYAADITARRIDSAVHNEIFKAAEEWQKEERRTAAPTSAALRNWLGSSCAKMKSHSFASFRRNGKVPSHRGTASGFLALIICGERPNERLVRRTHRRLCEAAASHDFIRARCFGSSSAPGRDTRALSPKHSMCPARLGAPAEGLRCALTHLSFFP